MPDHDNDERYLVDHIFPERTIHLFSGPAGCGVSTLLFQTGRDWARGEPVFNNASHPVPFCFVSCERPLSAAAALMSRLDMPRLDFPHISLLTHRIRPEERTFRTVLHLAEKKVLGVRALWIDGFTSLCPDDITKNKVVRDWLSPILEECDQRGLTIFGTAQSVKIRGDSYQSSHDRVMGSGLLVSMTSAKTYLQYAKPSDITDPRRQVIVAPQNVPSWKIDSRVEAYGIVPYVATPDIASADVLGSWLATAPDTFTTAEAVAAAATFGYSDITAKRWLAEQEELGNLIREKVGLYRKAA